MRIRHLSEFFHRSGVQIVGLVQHMLRGEEAAEMYREVVAILKEEMARQSAAVRREEARLRGKGGES
ncbi:MAG: hypothetical protein U0746_02800 [Gemmataceae bacterium]